MKVLVTGASTGVGKAVCTKFLNSGFEVYGIDILGSSTDHINYHHNIVCDISQYNTLPEITNVNIVINCQEVHGTADDIKVNLVGTLNIIKKYGLQPNIRSIVNQSTVAVHNGAEFADYIASKGGISAYTKWAAKEVAKYGATCNCISFGGILEDANRDVMEDDKLWAAIMKQTPLKRWCTCEEAAEWIYMFAVVNRSCSGQDLIIDNLETLNNTYICNGEDINE